MGSGQQPEDRGVCLTHQLAVWLSCTFLPISDMLPSSRGGLCNPEGKRELEEYLSSNCRVSHPIGRDWDSPDSSRTLQKAPYKPEQC